METACSEVLPARAHSARSSQLPFTQAVETVGYGNWAVATSAERFSC